MPQKNHIRIEKEQIRMDVDRQSYNISLHRVWERKDYTRIMVLCSMGKTLLKIQIGRPRVTT